MKVIAIFFIYFLFCQFAFCAENHSCPHYSYSVGKLNWNTDNDEIIVHAGLPNPDSPSFQTDLVFCKKNNNLFSYKGDATFIGMYPLADVSQKIVTLWVSGNGSYFIRIFGYLDNKVSVLLDVTSFSIPELIYLSNIEKKADPSIIVSTRVIAQTGSEVLFFAEIFSWSGNAYKSNVFGDKLFVAQYTQIKIETHL